jgi:hypothetical protein
MRRSASGFIVLSMIAAITRQVLGPVIGDGAARIWVLAEGLGRVAQSR